MIAFHYPPFSGGSGVHRTLKFSRYLPQFGWSPIILTAHTRAYSQTNSQQLQEIPSDVLVKRAFALDTSRHLSYKGAYFKSLALPDRWISWLVGAVPLGLHLISKYKPDVIWSTYPIATAHLIGLVLSKVSRIPWAADFRDSMTEDNYPTDLTMKRCYTMIEEKTIAASQCSIFTASSTQEMYQTRYPKLLSSMCKVIPNGYDEDDFKDLDLDRKDSSERAQSIRIVHAGVVYPIERNPIPFFRALASLKKEKLITSTEIIVEFRGSGSEDLYASILQDLEIQDLVQILPALPYKAALRDCALADGLLLLQGQSCNHQIPAKAYEYLRLGKPILALVDEKGETARLLRDNGGSSIIDLNNVEALRQNLPVFFDAIRLARHSNCDREKIRRYSRRTQAAELGDILRAVAQGNNRKKERQ